MNFSTWTLVRNPSIVTYTPWRAPGLKQTSELQTCTRHGSRTGSTLSCKSFEDPHGVDKVVDLLRGQASTALTKHPHVAQLIEVVMDLGRPPLARFPSAGDEPLTHQATDHEDLIYATRKVGEFGADNRAGIEGTLHRISCIRNRDGEIVGLTCRVGRDIGGCVMMIADIVLSGQSILMMGRPGAGKTTAIRGICQILADACGKRVVVVDTSNEIGGDGDIPHPGIGRSRRLQVPSPEDQYHVMIEAVENHMPEVVVIDEIGTEMEAQAARTISQRGVQLVATAHGCTLDNIIKNPSLQELLGGITSVTLGDDEARRRNAQKTALERESPPVFDVAIEIIERTRWRIHHNLGEAVDILLAGGVGQGEIRTLHNNCDLRDGVGGRPPPPTLALPSLSLGKKSDLGSGRTYALEVNSGQPASSAVPLDANTHAGVAAPATLPSDGHETAENADISTDQKKNRLPPVRSRTWSTGRLRIGQESLLMLVTIGIDTQLVWDVLVAMELEGHVNVTTSIEDADLMIVTRMGFKMSGWVASDLSTIPLRIIDMCTVARLASALHSLLDLHPPSFQREGRTTLAQDSVEPFEICSNKVSPGTAPTTLSNGEQEALAEVQCAIEEIVIPRQQSVELLPRLPSVIKMQMKLVWENNLECDTVGSGNTMHVRIFPAQKRPRIDDTLQGAIA